MSRPNLTYEQLHRTTGWAYGEQPDDLLAEALAGIPPGPAVDLGGGQGRHALYLASRGFAVELVDLSDDALGQARRSAAELGLQVRTVRSNIAFYDPPSALQAVVAALVLHVPARHAALKTAEHVGRSMNQGALFYLTVPGFDEATRGLARDLLAAAGCEGRVGKHVVTRAERPRLPVPRRNETRAVGFRR